MQKSGKNGKQGWLIGLLIGAAVIGGGVGLYAYFSGKDKDKDKDDGSTDEGGGDYSPPVTNPDTVDLFSSLPTGSFPLKKGRKSKLVFALQKYLNCKGNSGTAASMLVAPLVIDGNFGSKTEAALKSVLGESAITSISNFRELVAKKGSLGTCEAVMLAKISEIQK